MISGHDFSGYQVLVVGGTRGDGHAIATSFADAGASVTVIAEAVRSGVLGPSFLITRLRLKLSHIHPAGR